MSSIDIPVLLRRVGRRTPVSDAQTPLRFVLCAGEVLRLPLVARLLPTHQARRPLAWPRARRLTVRALSGTAWVTHGGKDVVLEAGAQLELRRARRADGGAVISSLGAEALLVETRVS